MDRISALFDTFDDNDFELRLLQAWAEELDNEAAGEGSSRPRRPRRDIRRDREGAGVRLWEDYFQEGPRWPEDYFKRRFRMRKQLFLRIVQGILDYPVRPLPPHFDYLIQKRDAVDRLGFTTLQKCTSALRQLAYGTSADILDEYLHMSELVSSLSLDAFCQCVIDLYKREYLRKPTAQDVQRLYEKHEERHGFRGMLGSIDCMHWEWRNCPTGWKGHYTGGHKNKPTLVLEAVASYDLWIWHSFFGCAGSNNDINVLNRSPLFESIKNGSAPESPFIVNGHTYKHGYYLADGIYPDWATLMKSYSAPTDDRRARFKRYQESARKDVERAFGVLQTKWHILSLPGRPHDIAKMSKIMYTCIILHNMIVEDGGFAITSLDEEVIPAPRFTRRPPNHRDRSIKEKEIRDKEVHDRLREDLTEHISNLPPNFRQYYD